MFVVHFDQLLSLLLYRMIYHLFILLPQLIFLRFLYLRYHAVTLQKFVNFEVAIIDTYLLSHLDWLDGHHLIHLLVLPHITLRVTTVVENLQLGNQSSNHGIRVVMIGVVCTSGLDDGKVFCYILEGYAGTLFKILLPNQAVRLWPYRLVHPWPSSIAPGVIILEGNWF